MIPFEPFYDIILPEAIKMAKVKLYLNGFWSAGKWRKIKFNFQLREAVEYKRQSNTSSSSGTRGANFMGRKVEGRGRFFYPWHNNRLLAFGVVL